MLSNRQAAAAVTLATAVASGLAAAIGVLARGDGSVRSMTSVRGETVDVATTGVYAWNAQRVVAEGIGWDLVTLLLVTPMLVAVAWLIARGSFRGLLLGGGLLGYVLYLELEYAVTWAFGPLFVLFVVAFVLALTGLGLVVAELRNVGIADRFDETYPRRGLPVLLVTMASLLTVLWLGRIGQALTAGIDGVLLGETTMTVQALDLMIVVPVSVTIAALVWRGADLGLVAGASFSVTFLAMSAAITSMLLSAWAVEGVPEAPPIAIFGTATVASAWLGERSFRSARSTPAPADVRRATAAPAPV
jgi:hypothetical protein